MRIIIATAIAGLLLLLAAPGRAQLSMPTSIDDYSKLYVTAYYDHGGTTDWNCGTKTYSGHGGTDFGGGSWSGMYEGRDITAAAAGIVHAVNDGVDDTCSTGNCGGGGGYGNYVQINQYDGYRTTYAHLRTWSVAVVVGQIVECGDLLGLMGSSGNSTGPHLHFDIRVPGQTRFDPFAGPCSPTPESFWAVQGPHLGLPAIQCGDPAVCEPVALITCGDEVASSNDGAGSTTGNFFYGCPGGWMYSGPEIAYRFVTDLDEPVTVTLTGLSEDLDLFALESAACAGDDCIEESTNSGTNDEELTFEAAAGVEVVLVVDGWQGAVSGFNLAVQCEGGIPEEDEPDAGPDGDTDADTDGDTDADSDSDTDADADGGQGGTKGSGCGCRAAGPRPSGLLAALIGFGY